MLFSFRRPFPRDRPLKPRSEPFWLAASNPIVPAPHLRWMDRDSGGQARRRNPLQGKVITACEADLVPHGASENVRDEVYQARGWHILERHSHCALSAPRRKSPALADLWIPLISSRPSPRKGYRPEALWSRDAQRTGSGRRAALAASHAPDPRLRPRLPLSHESRTDPSPSTAVLRLPERAGCCRQLPPVAAGRRTPHRNARGGDSKRSGGIRATEKPA
jgi:hypothetical protein